MTTTQFTTLIFVLLTLVSAGHLSLRMNNQGQSFTKTNTSHNNNFLGSAGQFAVLAGSAITSKGVSKVNGAVGLFPGTAISGKFNVSNGSIHAGDSFTKNAKMDLNKAYRALKNQNGAVNLTEKNLGGMKLAPGVYKFN